MAGIIASQSIGLRRKAAAEILPFCSAAHRAEILFCNRIHAQIVGNGISSAQLFRVKTNVFCALKKLYSLVQSEPFSQKVVWWKGTPVEWDLNLYLLE